MVSWVPMLGRSGWGEEKDWRRVECRDWRGELEEDAIVMGVVWW